MKKKSIHPGSYVQIKSADQIDILCDAYKNNYVYKRTMKSIAGNIYCVTEVHNGGYLKLEGLHDGYGNYGPYFRYAVFPYSIRTSFVEVISNPDVVPTLFGTIELSEAKKLYENNRMV